MGDIFERSQYYIVSPTNPPSEKSSLFIILNLRWVKCFQSDNGNSNVNFSFHQAFSSSPALNNNIKKDGKNYFDKVDIK